MQERPAKEGLADQKGKDDVVDVLRGNGRHVAAQGKGAKAFLLVHELADAEKEKASYEEKRLAFDNEVKSERNKMSKEVEAERERRVTAAKDEADKIVSDARAEAERKKDEIIESAQKEITDMVTEAMEKLTLEQSASDAFDQFLAATEETDK